MASLRKRGRVWYYRYVDADGVKRSRKGCTDRRATEELARAADAEAAKIRAGLVDVKDLARRDYQARPLSEHLTAWRDAMLNQGNTPKHSDQSADRVRRLIAVMFGARPDDIDGKTMSRSRQEQARATIDRLVAKAKIGHRHRAGTSRHGDVPRLGTIGPDVQPLSGLRPRLRQLGLEDRTVAGQSLGWSDRLQRQGRPPT